MACVRVPVSLLCVRVFVLAFVCASERLLCGGHSALSPLFVFVCEAALRYVRRSPHPVTAGDHELYPHPRHHG